MASEYLEKIKNIKITRIIYTDIDRDGTKLGSNLEGTINFSNLTNVPVLVSGGVASINEVIDIKKRKFPNIEGIVIGKAIYDGSIDIKELSKII